MILCFMMIIICHYKAIQNMYNSGANYGLILEDDMSIALLPFVEESLDQIAKNAPKNWNVIILYNKNVLDKNNGIITQSFKNIFNQIFFLLR